MFIVDNLGVTGFGEAVEFGLRGLLGDGLAMLLAEGANILSPDGGVAAIAGDAVVDGISWVVAHGQKGTSSVLPPGVWLANCASVSCCFVLAEGLMLS